MIKNVAASPTPDLTFISQHLFTAILWVDSTLSIQWLNSQTEQLLAISYKRLLNKSILSLLAPDELTSDKFNRRAIKQSNFNAKNHSQHDALKACSLTERFTQAQQYQQPFIDHDYLLDLQPSGGVAVLIDYSVTPVTYNQQPFFIIEMWGKDRQSRITEEQRQQQQYNVARHMLRSVAHEVKNPLAGIRGATQLLQRQFTKLISNDKPLLNAIADSSTFINNHKKSKHKTQATAQKLQTYTDIILSETDRLTHLIGQLLGSNQLPNWQTLNIHEPLEHVLTLMLSQYPNINLQRDYDLSLPELHADKDQLIQVFLNLTNNACEAMRERQQPALANTTNQYKAISALNYQDSGNYQAQLDIQTRVAFQHTIGAQQHKQALQITISDNGVGIDPKFIDQIFFPMVTGRATGTGLGLAIVQDIISRHHGMIEVRSEYGQTRFTVYLPFTQPALKH